MPEFYTGRTGHQVEEDSMFGYRQQKIIQPDRVSKSGPGRKIGFHKFIVAFPIWFIMILSLTASGFPTPDKQNLDKFASGTYTGTFFFSFKHSFNQSSEAVEINYYDLESGYGNPMGNIKFSVGKDGVIRNVRIKINPFHYNIVSTLIAKTELSCKGYNASGVGFGWASVSATASKPPSLVPNTIQSPDIKLKSGGVVGFTSAIGDCGGNPPADSFINAIRYDIDSLPATPWDFTPTVIDKKWAAGTCTTWVWQTPDRSFECYWQVFRK
jgi:hypothetical protein